MEKDWIGEGKRLATEEDYLRAGLAATGEIRNEDVEDGVVGSAEPFSEPEEPNVEGGDMAFQRVQTSARNALIFIALSSVGFNMASSFEDEMKSIAVRSSVLDQDSRMKRLLKENGISSMYDGYTNDADVCEGKPVKALKKLRKPRKLKTPIVPSVLTGEFKLENFPISYRKKIMDKIAEFTADCEIGEKCVKQQILEAAKRAGPFLASVKRMVAEKGLPPIVAYLPFAESLWQQDIMSHAGAYGPAQFMSATARQQGFVMSGEFSYFRPETKSIYKGKKGPKGKEKDVFEHDTTIYKYPGVYLYDQRRGLEAFEKMAEYLERIRSYIKNRTESDSYIYTLTAYNTGMGRISSFLENINEKDKKKHLAKFLQAASEFSSETHNYVANIIAFSQAVQILEKTQPNLFVEKQMTKVSYDLPKSTIKVCLESGETPSHIAFRHNMSIQDLLEKNNISWSDSTSLSVGHEFDVEVNKNPMVSPGMIRRHLKMTMAEFYGMNPGIHDPRKQIAKLNLEYEFDYKVKKGDTYKKIAKLYKDRGVTVSSLKSKNGDDISKVGSWIKVGARAKVWNSSSSNGGRLSKADAEKIENIMPPIPSDWDIYVPAAKKGALRRFIKRVQTYCK